MSVLCCHAPHFLYRVASCAERGLQERPVALLGPDESAWALSPAAGALGLHVGMMPRQIRATCPEARLHPLDLRAIEAAQQAWLGYLGELALPMEPADWGAAYLDLRPVTTDSQEVAAIAATLGRRMRQHLGAALQPALGWDSGKFTARAAALRTAPGRMKLVPAVQEKRFLAPLPLHLLPLSASTLQQLTWLGIETIGAFAALPDVAVWQRFGQEGKLALALARGRDKRPVQNHLDQRAAAIQLAWEPPTPLIPPVLAALETRLTPRLAQLRVDLQGCLGLALTLHFAEGSSRTVTLRLMQPTTMLETLLWRIQHELTLLCWPDALDTAEITLETGELPVQQLSLFAAETDRSQSVAELAALLKPRHGGIFFQGSVTEAIHPIPERRSRSVAIP
ncbi:MAG: hypothetical protein R2932_48610 [Caldilineaceae bacterium]